MKIRKFFKFWKDVIGHQINKPRSKLFYFFLGIVVTHVYFNILYCIGILF